MEEQRKKEVGEIEVLIKQSAQELSIEKIAEENAPPQAAVDITRLFEHGGGQLEMAVRKETDGGMQQLHGYESFVQAYEDYSHLKKVMAYAVSGSLNEDLVRAVDKIGERLQRFKYESASEEAVNLVVASRAALHKIRRYAGLE